MASVSKIVFVKFAFALSLMPPIAAFNSFKIAGKDFIFPSASVVFTPKVSSAAAACWDGAERRSKTERKVVPAISP